MQTLNSAIELILESYKENTVTTQCDCSLPNRKVITTTTIDLMEIIFPGFFKSESPNTDSLPSYITNLIYSSSKILQEQIKNALLNKECNCNNIAEVEKKAQTYTTMFYNKMPEIRKKSLTDVKAAFDGDPSATDTSLIISSYPGIFATIVHRLAHELYLLKVPYLPRIMSEYAHGKTGIDIHPGATIGKSFFIDHGTGVVIGESTIIGDNVKIYQGVTLGALSLKEGQSLKGSKRHPTVGNNVTIYSGASVLGGNTVIGDNVTIGGNAFVTSSIYKESGNYTHWYI